MNIFKKFVFLACLVFLMTISFSGLSEAHLQVTGPLDTNSVELTPEIVEFLRENPNALDIDEHGTFRLNDFTVIEVPEIDTDRLRQIYCATNPDKCAVNCEKDPDADECDPDEDGIINKDDSCKDKAEIYDTDGQTPVDGVLDGCPTETGGPDPVDPDENLPAQMSEGGACTLVRSENGFNFIAILLLSSLLLPLFISRLSAVKIRSRIRRDLKK